MNKVIVTTSINGATEAIRRFSEVEGWEMVVVLDKKSPEENGGEKLVNINYLSCEDQVKLDPILSDLIGWNCIQRRNFGFIYAIKYLEADIVATVDDDNIPMSHWGKKLMLGDPVVANRYDTVCGAFDPLAVTNHPYLWHRGFPLELVLQRSCSKPATRIQPFDIQAELWNGDPDVDAVCRMTEHATNISFDSDGFPACSDSPSPFNSQNTFLAAKVIPHYFMFPCVGRMDDIWAAYHAQAQGFKVVYCKPSVTQKRNDHNVTKDMINEFIGYEKNLDIIRSVNLVKNAVLKHLPMRAIDAFHQYQVHFD